MKNLISIVVVLSIILFTGSVFAADYTYVQTFTPNAVGGGFTAYSSLTTNPGFTGSVLKTFSTSGAGYSYSSSSFVSSTSNSSSAYSHSSSTSWGKSVSGSSSVVVK